ncbi:MAG: transcriptional regulator [Candidatus Bathycorpusculaceae bacterium]
MVSKDQSIGGIILIICVVIAIFYLATLFFPSWLEVLGLTVVEADVRFWVIAIPVFIAFVAIMGIGAWIGWTMATTPPPKPIEEITAEMEEKKEEEKPEKAEEPVEEAKAAEEPTEEEKKKRRKSEK